MKIFKSGKNKNRKPVVIYVSKRNIDFKKEKIREIRIASFNSKFIDKITANYVISKKQNVSDLLFNLEKKYKKKPLNILFLYGTYNF